jgi:predicted Ser/Thr protein kinase
MSPPPPSPDETSGPSPSPGEGSLLSGRPNLIGKRLGDYQIDRLLGAGGMGEVYLARQMSLEREVALKVLPAELQRNEIYLRRFEIEAKTAAKLNHKNVVQVYAIDSIDGVPLIAMEYVPGTNLRQYVSRKGPIALIPAISLMRQAAEAVAVAGEMGLIHRDIKPENMLLTPRGGLKIADFGLAKLPHSPSDTQEGTTVGTPLYMSPEQVQNRPVDHRSDLYSLGATFYHMLSGKPPFQEENLVTLAIKHVKEPPVSLAVHRPDLPEDLVKIVMKLLEKKPESRYQSADLLLKDLGTLRESIKKGLDAGAGASQHALEITTIDAEADSKTKPPPKIKRVRALVAATCPFRVTPWRVAQLAIASAIAGAAIGWAGRAPDLLGPKAPKAAGDPGLWMAPWEEIARQNTPAQQYQYALVRAPEHERLAAWLAVLGQYPSDLIWKERAQVQVARYLYRIGDAERLEVFGRELALAPRRGGQSGPSRDKAPMLAELCAAAAAEIRGDLQAVLDLLSPLKGRLMADGLGQFGVEIVAKAMDSGAPKQQASRGALAILLDDLRRVFQFSLPPGFP